MAMIAKLTGRLEAIEAERCVIDVNGVGYLVQASTRTLAALPHAAGGRRACWSRRMVREDAILLYGFADTAERDWFRLLTTVQGVGGEGGARHPLGAVAARADRGDRRPATAASLTRAARRRAQARGAAADRTAGEGRRRCRPAPACSPVRPPPRRRRSRTRSRRWSISAIAGPRRRPRWRAAIGAAGRRGRARRGDPRRPEGAGAMSERADATRSRPSAPRRMPPRPACGRRRSPSSSARRPAARTSPSSSRPRAAAARRSTTCCCTGRPASARPRWRRSSPASWASGFRATSGPVIQRAGDLAAILTNLQPRDVLFIDEIHRLQPAIEEVLYPGDGGFPARPDHRRGAGGAQRAHRPAALHAGRRHHARRPAGDAAARPLRHPAAPGLLHAGRARADRRARRGEARLRSDRGRRRGDRPALPRHAAHRRPAAAPGARLRRRRGRRTRSTAPSPTPR